jgi:hypothetical protein
MKQLSLLFILGILMSCSSVQEKKNLAERIQAEEVRSFQEIKSHAETLLEEHPELNDTTKENLRVLLHTTIKRNQDLKNEESKIFQLLLTKSLRFNQLTNQELKDKKSLKLQLLEVYDQKSENILSLIKKITEVSKQNVISESFKDDMIIMMRDFR